MEYGQTHLRIIGRITALAGLLALACLLVGALAVDMDFDAFSDPVLTLAHAHNHQLAYWFNILDLFGYYLLLLPVALHMHQRLRYRSPWMPLITLGGVGYAVIGASGAAVLAAVWPELMRDHLAAAPEEQATIVLVFKVATLAVTKGLWNILEMAFAATWWIGLGLLLRPSMPGIARLSIALGGACVLDMLGNLTGIAPLAEIGLNLYLLLSIIWSIAMGIRLMREANTPRPVHTH